MDETSLVENIIKGSRVLVASSIREDRNLKYALAIHQIVNDLS